MNVTICAFQVWADDSNFKVFPLHFYTCQKINKTRRTKNIYFSVFYISSYKTSNLLFTMTTDLLLHLLL